MCASATHDANRARRLSGAAAGPGVTRPGSLAARRRSRPHSDPSHASPRCGAGRPADDGGRQRGRGRGARGGAADSRVLACRAGLYTDARRRRWSGRGVRESDAGRREQRMRGRQVRPGGVVTWWEESHDALASSAALAVDGNRLCGRLGRPHRSNRILIALRLRPAGAGRSRLAGSARQRLRRRSLVCAMAASQARFRVLPCTRCCDAYAPLAPLRLRRAAAERRGEAQEAADGFSCDAAERAGRN